MQAAGISLNGMRHVKTQHYQLKCNWKVFCDNYLVSIDKYLSACSLSVFSSVCQQMLTLQWDC